MWGQCVRVDIACEEIIRCEARLDLEQVNARRTAFKQSLHSRVVGTGQHRGG